MGVDCNRHIRPLQQKRRVEARRGDVVEPTRGNVTDTTIEVVPGCSRTVSGFLALAWLHVKAIGGRGGGIHWRNRMVRSFLMLATKHFMIRLSDIAIAPGDMSVSCVTLTRSAIW